MSLGSWETDVWPGRSLSSVQPPAESSIQGRPGLPSGPASEYEWRPGPAEGGEGLTAKGPGPSPRPGPPVPAQSCCLSWPRLMRSCCRSQRPHLLGLLLRSHSFVVGFPLLRQFVGLQGGLSCDGREEGGEGTPPSPTQGHPLKAELPGKLTGKLPWGKRKSIQRASGEEPGLHSALCLCYFTGPRQVRRTAGSQGRRPLPH